MLQCRDAIRVYEALPEPKPSLLIGVYTSLAVAEASLGHLGEASEALELADAIIEKGGDLANEVVGRHHFERAKLLWAWGKHDEARTLAEQAIDRYAAASDFHQRYVDEVRAWMAVRAD